MNTKKVLRYLAIGTLTVGASITLGFLSFGGLFVILPILAPALVSFGLSVSYESQIYLQNIKHAWNKLFQTNYLKQQQANAFLLQNFPNTAEANCPVFFKEYKNQLELLHQFKDCHLDEPSNARKKHVTARLGRMEEWFALQLFPEGEQANPPLAYEQEVREWLAPKQDAAQKQIINRRRLLHGVKVFSALAAVFMSLGTSYLLVEAVAIIPIVASLAFLASPAMLVGMSLMAGMAYGFLTYNAITDMINNDTLKKWYHDIRNRFREDGLTVKNVAISLLSLTLVALAVTLTVCTAGTWWTIAQQATPLFTWMSKIPVFVMAIVNPIIIGISALLFGVENTRNTIKLIVTETDKPANIFTRTFHKLKEDWEELRAQETWLQLVNPFRMILKILLLPLQVLLFLGHVISIGVTADRMPGMSKELSTGYGVIGEIVEDLDYFVAPDPAKRQPLVVDPEQERQHIATLLEDRLGSGNDNHDHETNIPTMVLKVVFTVIPLYPLAALWDWVASNNLSLLQAWNRQWDHAYDDHVEFEADAPKPSVACQKAQLRGLIQKGKHRLGEASVDRAKALAKVAGLTTLETDISAIDNSNAIQQRLLQEADAPVYNKHRLFGTGKTTTGSLIDDMQQIMTPIAA